MKIEEIKYFIERFLGTKPYVVGKKWVMTNCPFASITHIDGDDKRFSFGISIDNGYHCFTCSEKGHIRSLPFKIWKYFQNPKYIEMLVFIEKAMKAETARQLGENVYVIDEMINEDEKKEEDEKEKLVIFRDMPSLPSYVREFSLLKFIEDDVLRWDIRYNFLDQSVLFPIYDKNKQLVNVKARRQLADGRKVFYFWCKGNKNIWYGEHLLGKSKYLFLVEGERDAILLSRYVENVWASMGMPTIEMIKKLPDNKITVLFFDNDSAGAKIKQKVLKYLNRSEVYVIEGYEYKDPAEVVEHSAFEQVLKKIKKIKR